MCFLEGLGWGVGPLIPCTFSIPSIIAMKGESEGYNVTFFAVFPFFLASSDLILLVCRAYNIIIKY